jgi:hypothetical protein
MRSARIRTAVAAGVLIACLVASSAVRASTGRSLIAPQSAQSILAGDELQPGRSYTYVNGAVASQIAAIPRPLADQIEDVLAAPAMQDLTGGYVVQPDGSVTVYVVQGASAIVTAAIDALGPQVAGLFTLSPVRYSWSQLVTFEMQVSNDFPTNFAGSDWSVPFWAPDPTSNTVDFYVTGNIADAEQDMANAYPGMPMSFEAAPAGGVVPDNDNRYNDGGNARFRGGDEMILLGPTECTDGFTVKGRVSGAILQMTAGHCMGGEGNPVFAYAAHNEKRPFGDILTNRLFDPTPRDFEGLSCDFGTCTGFVWFDDPSLRDTTTQGSLRRVAGTCTCGNGQKVTVDGSVTGQFGGFNVNAFTTNKTDGCINNDDGFRVCGLHLATGTTTGCRRGDSGGPVYQKGPNDDNLAYAAGILVASFGADPNDPSASSNQCLFEPISQILNAANTKIVVGAAASPNDTPDVLVGSS